MKASDLTEFQIEEEGLKLKIKRGSDLIPVNPASATQVNMTHGAIPVSSSQTPTKPVDDTNIHIIKSPMVGSFYQAASPDSPPFAKVGDKVSTNSVVCIIEAMKVMNEIQAETSGSIVEILVENGQTIEYGQPLFKVKKG